MRERLGPNSASRQAPTLAPSSSSVPRELRGGAAVPSGQASRDLSGGSPQVPGLRFQKTGSGKGLSQTAERATQSLPGAVGARFGAALDVDLGPVQVVPDSPLAQGLGVNALAHNEVLHFSPGKYKPGTPEGDRLIAHELAHVVQQRGGTGAGSGDEGQAEHAAVAMIAGQQPALGKAPADQPQYEERGPQSLAPPPYDEAAFLSQFRMEFGQVDPSIQAYVKASGARPATGLTALQKQKLWKFFHDRQAPEDLFGDQPLSFDPDPLPQNQKMLIAANVLAKTEVWPADAPRHGADLAAWTWSYVGINPSSLPTGGRLDDGRWSAVGPARRGADGLLRLGHGTVAAEKPDWTLFSKTPTGSWLRIRKGEEERSVLLLHWKGGRNGGQLGEVLGLVNGKATREELLFAHYLAKKAPPQQWEVLSLLRPQHWKDEGDGMTPLEADPGARPLQDTEVLQHSQLFAAEEAVEANIQWMRDVGVGPAILHSSLMDRAKALAASRPLTEVQRTKLFSRILAEGRSISELQTVYSLTRLQALIQAIEEKPVTGMVDPVSFSMPFFARRRDLQPDLNALSLQAQQASFARMFRENLGPIKMELFERGDETERHALSDQQIWNLFSQVQRQQLKGYFRTRRIPERFFTGATEDQLKALGIGKRVILSGHLLSMGQIEARDPTVPAAAARLVSDRPRADNCGHFANWTWIYAGVNPAGTSAMASEKKPLPNLLDPLGTLSSATAPGCWRGSGWERATAPFPLKATTKRQSKRSKQERRAAAPLPAVLGCRTQ